MRLGIFISFLNARGRPVGAAKGVDTPSRLEFIEHLDNRPNGLAGVIPMENIEVDVIGAQASQRIVQVRGDVIRGHPLAILVVVRPLAEHDDLVTQPALVVPVAEGPFAVAVAIAVGGVKGGAAEFINTIALLHALFELLHPNIHRALHEPRDRFVDTGDIAVFHLGCFLF